MTNSGECLCIVPVLITIGDVNDNYLHLEKDCQKVPDTFPDKIIGKNPYHSCLFEAKLMTKDSVLCPVQRV